MHRYTYVYTTYIHSVYVYICIKAGVPPEGSQMKCQIGVGLWHTKAENVTDLQEIFMLLSYVGYLKDSDVTAR